MLVTFRTPYRGSLNAFDFSLQVDEGEHFGQSQLIDLSRLLRSFTSVWQTLTYLPCDRSNGRMDAQDLKDDDVSEHLIPPKGKGRRTTRRKIEQGVDGSSRHPVPTAAAIESVHRHVPAGTRYRRECRTTGRCLDRYPQDQTDAPSSRPRPLPISSPMRPDVVANRHGSLPDDADARAAGQADSVTHLTFPGRMLDSTHARSLRTPSTITFRLAQEISNQPERRVVTHIRPPRRRSFASCSRPVGSSRQRTRLCRPAPTEWRFAGEGIEP